MSDKEAKRLYDIEYRRKNRELIKAKKKAYYEANKKRILAEQKLKNDNDQHRAKHAEYCRRPNQRKKERINRYKRVFGDDFKNKKKFCIVCEESKFILEFQKCSSYPDNRRYICNKCEDEFQKQTGYSTKGAVTAIVSRRYTNLTREDIAKHPYLIEVNKYLILLKQLIYGKCEAAQG